MKSFVVAALVGLTPTFALGAEKKEDAEKKALASATAWLKLSDAGDYSKAWDASATYLKDAVDQETFDKSLRAARKPLGKVVSRKLKSKEYATSLPGAPDGEYVVMQYTTSFEHKKSAVETITASLENDKSWKISGYYIR